MDGGSSSGIKPGGSGADDGHGRLFAAMCLPVFLTGYIYLCGNTNKSEIYA